MDFLLLLKNEWMNVKTIYTQSSNFLEEWLATVIWFVLRFEIV